MRLAHSALVTGTMLSTRPVVAVGRPVTAATCISATRVSSSRRMRSAGSGFGLDDTTGGDLLGHLAGGIDAHACLAPEDLGEVPEEGHALERVVAGWTAVCHEGIVGG